jgi:uncharacterized membrane protein
MEKIRLLNFILSIILLLLIGILLFHDTLISNKPLGADTIGHLSRVVIVKNNPFSSWKQAWYCGMPLLKSYSPFYFYFLALFSNIIFWSNFFTTLSILLSAFGIFLLVYLKSKKILPSLISGICFFTVLAISYYYVATGNIPYVFSLFLLPFSLYFFEKSIKNKNYFLIYTFFFVLSILSHILIAFCIIILMIIRLYFLTGLKIGYLKKLFIYLVPGILISCFWFIPFLSKTSQYIGVSEEYSPSLSNLFAITDHFIWGVSPGQIGIILYIGVFLLLLIPFYYKSKYIKFLLISSFILFFLVINIFGNIYPSGISPSRLILPFSVVLSMFIGLVISKLDKNKILYFLLIVFVFSLLLFGIFINMKIINKNFKYYSYIDNRSRYFFMDEITKNISFPLNKTFDNYRFASKNYVFSETLNFFLPGQSQIGGYNVQGILYPLTIDVMKDKLWKSDDLNSTLFYLDYFGIKYFEVDKWGSFDMQYKFSKNPELFEKVFQNNDYGHSFKLYRYTQATPIISLLNTNVRNLNNSINITTLSEKNIGFKKFLYLESKNTIKIDNEYKMLNFSWKRPNPDKVIIEYNLIDKGSIILFKEFYHKSWRAKEYPSKKNLEIYRSINNLMVVIPDIDSDKVIFYQSKTLFDYIGYILTIFGLILLFIFYKKYYNKST